MDSKFAKESLIKKKTFDDFRIVCRYMKKEKKQISKYKENINNI